MTTPYGVAAGEAPVHAPARGVTRLTSDGSRLTVYTGNREAGVMRYELLLYGRVHVDLVRYASARCWDH
ncbi:putative leader peptide [Streptomyces sp. ISL-94]|uniref:putative leader peptide n=1 Tax=Streptomyces sp. ISL-94 TaxID=2819190 RepID=UPI0035B1F00E